MLCTHNKFIYSLLRGNFDVLYIHVAHICVHLFLKNIQWGKYWANAWDKEFELVGKTSHFLLAHCGIYQKLANSLWDILKNIKFLAGFLALFSDFKNISGVTERLSCDNGNIAKEFRSPVTNTVTIKGAGGKISFPCHRSSCFEGSWDLHAQVLISLNMLGCKMMFQEHLSHLCRGGRPDTCGCQPDFNQHESGRQHFLIL